MWRVGWANTTAPENGSWGDSGPHDSMGFSRPLWWVRCAGIAPQGLVNVYNPVNRRPRFTLSREVRGLTTATSLKGSAWLDAQ